MELLFLAYVILLLRHGLQLIPQKNQNMAVSHVIPAIRPAQLRDRFESDLQLSKTDLRKDFKGFMEHAVKVSLAFEMVDNGPPGPKKQKQNARDNWSRLAQLE